MLLLKRWLAHPLTSDLDIDDPQTTILRRRIIREKAFLRKIYQEWYRGIAAALPEGPGCVLELGSGPGFLKEYIPEVITSEVFHCPGVDLVLDGMQLPIANGTLRAILMTDVLHHIPNVRKFLSEAGRCIRPGGVIVMVEPWVSAWSRLVYQNLHHEPFEPEAEQWELQNSKPLSGANGALAWILFERDYQEFKTEFPQWRLTGINHLMPFRYLLSGGISLRTLMPGWAFRPLGWLESLLLPWRKSLAMFGQIVLVRLDVNRN